MLRSDMGRHKMLSFSSKTRGRNVLYKRTLYVGLIAQLTMISSNKVQLIMPIIGWIYEKLFEIRAVRSWDCEKFEIGIKVRVEIGIGIPNSPAWNHQYLLVLLQNNLEVSKEKLNIELLDKDLQITFEVSILP